MRFTRRRSDIRSSEDVNIYKKVDKKKDSVDSNVKKYRYKEIKSVVVSDSGIFHIDDPLTSQNMQPTSIVYYGPYMYFWVQ